MPDATTFMLFLAAATLLALTPGPGIFYVLTRSLKGGRSEGLASSFGTAVGGFGHVLAAAFGLSALLATSAAAFALVKYAGAAYLIYLGIRTLRQQDVSALANLETMPRGMARTQTWQAFRQGIVTEALNPKTAIFFLAFLPHFVDPAQPILAQFVLLGTVSVCLNTGVDVVVALVAGELGQWLQRSARLRQGQRHATGLALLGLGAYVAVAETGQ